MFPRWGDGRLILSEELSEGLLLLYLIHKLLLISGVKDRKEKHFTLFCILGTCINNTSVMMFKKGSFEIGATVYPVAIKVGAPPRANGHRRGRCREWVAPAHAAEPSGLGRSTHVFLSVHKPSSSEGTPPKGGFLRGGDARGICVFAWRCRWVGIGRVSLSLEKEMAPLLWLTWPLVKTKGPQEPVPSAPPCRNLNL